MLRAWRIFTASFIMLSLVAGAGICYGFHELESYREKTQMLEKANVKIAALNKIQIEHPNLEAYQMEIAKKRQMAELLLPASIQMADLLAYIQKTARYSGLELQELVPMDEKPKGKLQVHPVKVRLAGEYFHVLEFLRQLDKGSPLVQVSSMELKQQSDGLASKLILQFYSG